MSPAQIRTHQRDFYSLGSHLLFSSLPQAGSRELESKLVFARHSAGSILYQQGEKPKGIFLIFAGRVKITAHAGNERTALLKVAGPGEVLGLASTLSQRPHFTTGQASEPSFRGLLPGDALLNCMQKYSQLPLAVAQCLAAESIESARDALLLRVPCSRAQRLATALLCLADGNGAIDYPRALVYTHAELGQMIGASRETVTRLMKKPKTKGLITTRKSRFRIRERELLRANCWARYMLLTCQFCRDSVLSRFPENNLRL